MYESLNWRYQVLTVWLELDVAFKLYEVMGLAFKLEEVMYVSFKLYI